MMGRAATPFRRTPKSFRVCLLVDRVWSRNVCCCMFNRRLGREGHVGEDSMATILSHPECCVACTHTQMVMESAMKQTHERQQQIVLMILHSTAHSEPGPIASSKSDSSEDTTRVAVFSLLEAAIGPRRENLQWWATADTETVGLCPSAHSPNLSSSMASCSSRSTV